MGGLPGRRAFVAYGAAGLLAACTPVPAGRDASPSVRAVEPLPSGSMATAASPTSAPSTSTSAPSPVATSRPAAPPTEAPAAARQPGPDITAGTSERPEVALTFHGQGDPAIARGILAGCARAGAGITVFAVGQWVDQYPALAREIVAAGHDLGNHTWSHPDLGALSLAAATDEIRRCADALRRAIGSPGWYFRPSSTVTSTATIRQAAQAAGYARCIGYGVDPEDFREPGPSVVRSRTKAGLRPGAIVSLHFGHQGTLDALPGLLSDISAAGLRAVTLTTLLTT